MVRHKIISVVVCCALALLLAVPASASAYTVYTEGNINSDYLDLFRSIIAKQSFSDDYLLFRADQFDYVLIVGDLDFVDGVFMADSAKEYKISHSAGIGYNSGYAFTVTDLTDFSLVPLDSLVYSNLGDYPELHQQSDLFQFSQLFLLLVSFCMWLTRDLFSFTLRRGYSV